jgi:hypothetical protein
LPKAHAVNGDRRHAIEVSGLRVYAGLKRLDR